MKYYKLRENCFLCSIQSREGKTREVLMIYKENKRNHLQNLQNYEVILIFALGDIYCVGWLLIS